MFLGLYKLIINNILCLRRFRCFLGIELEILCKIVMILVFEMIILYVKIKDIVWVKYDLNNFY